MSATAIDSASLATNDIHWLLKKATFDTVASHRARLDLKSVCVIVDFFFMGQMDVIVSAVVARVVMVMDRGVSMIMPMLVLMTMLVPVGMRVFMSMRLISMFMFVGVAVGVFVRVQVFVFVVALHCELLSLGFTNWLPNNPGYKCRLAHRDCQ